MGASVLAHMQRLADAAAAEAAVMSELQPIADLCHAMLAAYRARGVPEDLARRLMLALVPVILAAEIGSYAGSLHRWGPARRRSRPVPQPPLPREASPSKPRSYQQ